MKKLLIFDAYGTLISTGNGSMAAVQKILALQQQPINPDYVISELTEIYQLNL